MSRTFKFPSNKNWTKEELISFVKEEIRLWEEGKIRAPIHACGGNEDQLIEIFKEIKPNDYVLSSHRNTYHAILHGVDRDALMAEILGDAKGKCNGRARSMGFIDASRNFYSSAIVGGMCGIGVGIAWALKQEQDNFRNDPLNIDEFAVKPPSRHVWCFVGDGVLDGGHFWEALQYVESNDLPLTFVVEDNNRATCSDKLARGIGNSITRNTLGTSKHIIGYAYEPTYPHVGNGKYVAF
jgi:pyruvate dehydrogenase E1 component alpha subunit